ncbi:SDR family oxidoreductase [Acaricomes phytoseiuli]|uniref:SDR family NAD(P)-dependent oxidoreductase n=1 Tax=Acaricomes phytoseiuli TaxID=291968 RepID=UPI0003752007|nr:SDR family oxidoreductase [Acaricomes phytoseiuli]MCW1250394.1 SDR family oxidoreductase [Acaricomes phytoseiuli]
MQIDLSGKTALVTGSTQGIGSAIAAALAEAGATVGVNGRDADRVAAAIRQIGAGLEDSSRLIPAPGDVTTETGVEAALAALPTVDILVNSLGVFGAADPLEIPDAEWLRYFETNVLTAVRLTRATMPAMIERGWGRVVNIASDSAIVIPAEMIHYGMTKTSLLAVSRGFAKACSGTGVTVNSVIAGPTHTAGVEDFVYQLVDKSLPWDEAQREFMKEYRPQSLLGRLIEPEEIAAMVAYLASPLASATTGGALRVDGGYVDAILP